MLYRFVIENIGVRGAVFTALWLSREGGGGQIHRPEQHAGGAEIDIAGVHDAHDFDAVEVDVAEVHGQVEPGEAGEAAGAGGVVETGADVEVVAAAGAPTGGGGEAVASVGEGVAAERDDHRVRVHGDLRGIKHSG